MNSKKYFICENCGFEDIVDEFGYCPVCNPEQLSDEEKEAEEDNGSKGHCYFLGVMEGKCRLGAGPGTGPRLPERDRRRVQGRVCVPADAAAAGAVSDSEQTRGGGGDFSASPSASVEMTKN